MAVAQRPERIEFLLALESNRDGNRREAFGVFVNRGFHISVWFVKGLTAEATHFAPCLV